jgi:hypothetical protein
MLVNMGKLRFTSSMGVTYYVNIVTSVSLEKSHEYFVPDTRPYGVRNVGQGTNQVGWQRA